MLGENESFNQSLEKAGRVAAEGRIGTGFVGGSSIGDNLTPHHLLHFARIAYNKEASEA